jgi:hypothetical protein
MEFIITFGHAHAERSGESWRSAKGYAVLEAPRLPEAIYAANALFGDNYSMVRLPGEISEDDLRRYFPQGEVARASVDPETGEWAIKVH